MSCTKLVVQISLLLLETVSFIISNYSVAIES